MDIDWTKLDWTKYGGPTLRRSTCRDALQQAFADKNCGPPWEMGAWHTNKWEQLTIRYGATPSIQQKQQNTGDQWRFFQDGGTCLKDVSSQNAF